MTSQPASFDIQPHSTNLSEQHRLQDPLQGLQPCLCRSVWTLVRLQSKGASKSDSEWRHQCISLGRTCMEGGAQHRLAECQSARSEPAILEAKILVGVMAHQQRAETPEQKTWPSPWDLSFPAHEPNLIYYVRMCSLLAPPPLFVFTI